MGTQKLPHLKKLFSGFSIEHLWSITVLAGIFIFLNTHPIRPQDFWWHATIGKEILATGQIPQTDTFSFTAQGQPYPSYQIYWFMEIWLYQLYSWGGPALVVFSHALLITSAYGIILWICRQRSGNWRIAALGTVFAAALGLNDWNVRPQAVTFLLSALILWAITKNRLAPQKRYLAVFPLSMFLWVNSHGSFPIGLLLMGLWFAEEGWKIYQTGSRDWHKLQFSGMALLLGSIACLLNPRGPGIVQYLITMTSNNSVQQLATEWAPPSFDTQLGIFFLGGLLLGIAVLARSPRRPGIFDLGLFLILAAMGLKTSRGSVWFGLLLAPTLTSMIGWKPAPPARTQSLLNRLLAGAILTAVIFTLPWFKDRLPMPPAKAGLISSETPLTATQFLLQERPPTPIFNDMAFGSYLIWAAQPDYPIFVDSRIELYSPQIWDDYIAISAADTDWENRLDHYQIQTLMLSTAEQPDLIQAVQNSSHWQKLYEDTTAVIFTRYP